MTATTVRAAPGEVVSIQVLRGLAAFGVLLFHAAERAGWHFGVGAAGVDVFFVISGFIMWVVTCDRPTAPGRFLLRRLFRIAPLYWLLTIAMVAVAVVIPSSFPALQPTWTRVALSLAFIPHHDPVGLVAPILVPGWTLNYEMFFYVVFAACLLAPARLRAWAVSGLLIALVGLGFAIDRSAALAATYTDPILLEFVAGLWLGRAWTSGRSPGVGWSWALLAAGVAGFAATALVGLDVSVARALLWGAPAVALVAGALGLERAGRALVWTPLRRLGDASYSLYLGHGLAISAVIRALGLVGVSAPLAIYAVSILAGCAVGFGLYYGAERPLNRLLGAGLAARRPAPIPHDTTHGAQ